MTSAADDVGEVFQRVAALAEDTAELRERESVELQSLALALSDFAREHPLGEMPPGTSLSLRARMQARFRLGGTPRHLGEGLYLSAEGTLLVVDRMAPGRWTRELVGGSVLTVLAGLLVNDTIAVFTFMTMMFVLLASIVWRGVGTAYGFRELAPDEEHAALVYLRRTLARLENDVRDARGPSALPLPE